MSGRRDERALRNLLARMAESDRAGLSRRDLLRWAGVGGLGLALPSCSAAPQQDIVTTTVEPTEIQRGGTFSGRVTGLLTGRTGGGVTIEIAGVGTITADFGGNFSVRLPEAGDFRIKISGADFFTRETGIRLLGNVDVTITLIESDESLTLPFLDQFARGTGPAVDGIVPRTPGVSNRWLSRPRILLYRRLDGDPDTLLSDDRISQLRAIINAVWFGLTGGRFGSAPTIEEIDSAPPANRSQVPIGSICLFQSADGSRGGGHNGSIENRFAIANAHAFTGTEASDGVVARVLGQALGATFVEDSMASVMNAEGRSTLTTEDTLAARVLYDRPPGNGSPDVDPTGFFLNA